MNRRKFIQKAGKYTLATAAPFILPSGRLFAATESPRIKHVVYCMFAGGIRRWESVDQKEGNLMPNTLVGNTPISSDIQPGIKMMPRILDQPLQTQGTLLKGFRYNSTFTHHYPAHESAISGKYYYSNEMFQPIQYPSVFEYFRKHSGFGTEALKTWWLADKPGDFPYIQYSKDPNYGWPYAANMIQPSSLFKFSFTQEFDPHKQEKLEAMTAIINKRQAELSGGEQRPSLNSPEEKLAIKQFVQKIHQKHFKDRVQLWKGLDSELVTTDMINMFTACEVLKTFRPHLLVVNMQESDVGHFSFTGYCDNLHRADFALGQLWKTIQEDPVLKDNTVLIAQPEFGRNQFSNTVIDGYGRYAVDHSGDDISQQMFCLIAGPPGVVHQNKIVEEPYGEAIDTVPTIAHLLGFRHLIPDRYITGNILHEALV